MKLIRSAHKSNHATIVALHFVPLDGQNTWSFYVEPAVFNQNFNPLVPGVL